MAEGGLRGRLARSYAIAALVFVLLLFALFWRLWTPIEGARRAFGWDAQWQYWGDLQFQYDAYTDGDLPLWNPHDRGGYPFHADPQVGIFYPVTWALLGGAAVTGEVAHWWIAVKIFLHYFLACFGTWVYLRRRGLVPPACYLGGVGFIVGYPFLHNLFSALNWSIAWTPWILAALDALTARPTRPRGALLALAVGMCALAGGPASVLYSMLVALPYAVWAIASGARRAGSSASQERRSYLRAVLVSGTTALGLLLAIVAVQVHSTAAVLGETVRGDRDLEFITFSTFGFDGLASLLIPRLPSEDAYLGALTIILAAIALTAYLDARRLVLAGIAVIGLALALGQHADFLAAAASAFDPFGLFRRAHRYLYVVQLPVAILAAEGLHLVLREKSDELRRKVARGVLIWGALALLTFGFGVVANFPPTRQAHPLRDAFVLACAATAAAAWIASMLLRQSGAWRGAFAWLAVVFVTADLWLAHGPKIDRAMHPVPNTSRDRELALLEGVPDEVRIYDRQYLGFRPGTRLGIRDFGGYEDDPLALERYHLLLDRVRQAPRHLGHANVRWYLDEHRRPLRLGAADRKAMTAERKGVYRIHDVAPAIMWVDRAEVVDGGAREAISALLRGTPGTRAVLERPTLTEAELAAATRGEEGRPAVAGRLVELGRNRLVAEIEAPDDGVVVIHEAYFPGWRAWVDGEEQKIVPANGMFRGVFIGPGAHRIEMEYSAEGWGLLGAVSILGFLGAAGLAFIGLRRERRAGPAVEEVS